MSKRNWKEIRNDYVNKEENAIYIDAWKTGNDNEDGKVIAKIDCDTKEVTYLDEKAKTDEYAQEMIQEAIDSLEKVAVSVGYSFGFVPKEEMSEIEVKPSGVVRFEGENWTLMKAKTYEDSRKIDQLLDRYGEYAVKDYKLEPVMMNGVIEMNLPGFDKERDSFLWGSYRVISDGKEVPFDFGGMSWDTEQDGDLVTISFSSGYTPFANDFKLVDWFEIEYEEIGMRMQDVSAEFLSKASSIVEFMFAVEMEAFENSQGKEVWAEDIAKLGSFEIKELSFSNGKENYAVKEETIEAYNEELMSLETLIEKAVNNPRLSEMEKLEKIAFKQWTEQMKGNHEELIAIESEDDVSVVYPWMDSTGRYEVDPVKEYGEEAFKNFCNELKEKTDKVLNRNKDLNEVIMEAQKNSQENQKERKTSKDIER